MTTTVKFNSGEKDAIDIASVDNGAVYFSTDTKEIFLDKDNQRIEIANYTVLPNLGTAAMADSTDFAAASHTHTAEDIGAVAVDTLDYATDANVGSNQYGTYVRVDVDDGSSVQARVINWDDIGPFGSTYDGSNWTTVWDLRKPLIKVYDCSFTVGRSRGSNKSVTAKNVSGYTFLCWGQVATSGWIGQVYPASPSSQTSSFFVSVGDGSGNGTCYATAIYVKNGQKGSA